MQYTAVEKQMQYINDNDLDGDFLNAVFYNRRGYFFFPVTVTNMEIRNGKCYVKFHYGKNKDLESPITIEDDPEKTAARVMDYVKRGMLAAAVGGIKDKETGKTHYKLLVDREESIPEGVGKDGFMLSQLLDCVFQHCIDVLNLDTKEKIQQFIDEGWEVKKEQEE